MTGKVLVKWGEGPEYEYENTYYSVKEALEWVNDAFGGKVIWNRSPSGHWFKLHKEVELSEYQAYKEAE